ncbi:MAG: PEP/pyruvate-binding domain-containing protein [Oscillospiraceae bacterium]
MSKAENLKILKEHGINVPQFIVLNKGETANLDFSGCERFAVRSSCNAEDGNEAAFAGQFETLLNVERDDVSTAVELVRESFSSESAKQYAQQKLTMLAPSEGAVIVQEMINADCSGVMFTANPLGLLNEIVITVGYGLGENVVADKIRTTSYYYNRDDKQYFYTADEDTPLLSEKTLSELVKNALKIRSIFKREMDIEFAVCGDTLYILQARPITTLRGKGKIILDNSNIAESYPARTMPMTQDFAREVYYRIFRSLFLRVTGDEKLTESISANLKNMVAAADGSLYYCIENWYALLKLLPLSKKIISVWQNMLGVENKTIPDTQVNASAWTKLKIAVRFAYYIAVNPREMEKLNRWFEAKYPDFRAQVERARDIQSLLRVYHRLIKGITARWDVTLINDMYAFLFTALAGKKNKESLANIRNLESMRPVLELKRLAKAKGSPEFETLKAKYIEEYGDRCLGELKLETRTYRTNPELLDARINSEPAEYGAERDTPRKTKDGYFVKCAKLGISYRESSRLHRSRMFGLARKIMLKIGEILVAEGYLADRSDVFCLREEELLSPHDFKEIVARRKQEHENFKKIPVFGRLVFENEIFDHSSLCARSSVLSDESELSGVPASAGTGGVIEGEALVIQEPSAELDASGKIIVTTSTDPGWVFLIKDALGIVAEKGSLLSHTAIITRELGKPSIVNVPHAARKIRSGDILSMDASTGIIKIIGRRKTD